MDASSQRAVATAAAVEAPGQTSKKRRRRNIHEEHTAGFPTAELTPAVACLTACLACLACPGLYVARGFLPGNDATAVCALAKEQPACPFSGSLLPFSPSPLTITRASACTPVHPGSDAAPVLSGACTPAPSCLKARWHSPAHTQPARVLTPLPSTWLGVRARARGAKPAADDALDVDGVSRCPPASSPGR